MTQGNAVDLDQELFNIDFDVSKSIRYHDYRRAFWAAIDRWSKILTILTGTSVVVTILANRSDLSLDMAVAVAILSASDIVLGFGENVNFHNDQYRKYNKLSRRITKVSRAALTEDKIRDFRAERLKIERDERGQIDLLERRCAAEEAVARGVPINGVWQLCWFQILVSQVAIFPIPRKPKQAVSAPNNPN